VAKHPFDKKFTDTITHPSSPKPT